jgi:proline dehydrogenase
VAILRRALLGASRSGAIKHALSAAPLTRDVVARFVAGETETDALAVARQLVGGGLKVSLDHLGEDTLDRRQAERITRTYADLLARLADAGLSAACEVSVKLSALGLLVGHGGDRLALANADVICGAARAAGTTVTVDMEDHTTTESTLAVVQELRREYPRTGVALQAYLRRTEADCRDLAGPDSRVRLCKGAYDEPDRVAFRDRHEVDRSFVRCLRILMTGDGYPMVATHDPRLVAVAESLVRTSGRCRDTYEFQMLYGIRPTEQHRLAHRGHQMRVYVPYGTDWYAYLVRRLAERPANLAFFARNLVNRS